MNRYEIEAVWDRMGNGGLETTEDPDGEWVKYEDVKSEIDSLKQDLESAITSEQKWSDIYDELVKERDDLKAEVERLKEALVLTGIYCEDYDPVPEANEVYHYAITGLDVDNNPEEWEKLKAQLKGGE